MPIQGDYVYPKNPALQKQVPLWLKFYAHEYTNNSLLRANNSPPGSPPTFSTPRLASISVPAPTDLSTYSNVHYATDRKGNDTLADPVKTFSNWAGTGALVAAAAGQPEIAVGLAAGWALNEIVQFAVSEMNDLFLGSVLQDLDLSDTKFIGVSKRVFTFRLLMPALSEGDSEAASDVCDAFQAYQLPTTLIYPYAYKMRHPPLWRIGIGPADSLKYDTYWNNQPQLCLLSAVTINKTAFKGAYGVGSQGKVRPLAQSVTLEFVELEPNMRKAKAYSKEIESRSSSFY
jgi:hypothetical protein